MDKDSDLEDVKEQVGALDLACRDLHIHSTQSSVALPVFAKFQSKFLKIFFSIVTLDMTKKRNYCH